MKKTVTLALGLSLIASVTFAETAAERALRLKKLNVNAPTVTLDNKTEGGAVTAGSAALALVFALTSGSSSASSSSSGGAAN